MRHLRRLRRAQFGVTEGWWGAQDKILRRRDFFFVALVCFCKPLRAKQKATKETKGGKDPRSEEGLVVLRLLRFLAAIPWPRVCLCGRFLS
jgi:hypothetical protein